MAAPAPAQAATNGDEQGSTTKQSVPEYVANIEHLLVLPHPGPPGGAGGFVHEGGVDADYLPNYYIPPSKLGPLDSRRKEILEQYEKTERELRFLEMMEREKTKMIVAKQRLGAERRRRVRQRVSPARMCA